MATLPPSQTVTYEEWLTMPEAGDAIQEVVDGEIRIMLPRASLHGRHDRQDILKPKLFPHVHVDIAQIWPD